MEGALVVIPLVGLALPILMIFAAILFDAAVVVWAVYRAVHLPKWARPRFVGVSHTRRPLRHAAAH